MGCLDIPTKSFVRFERGNLIISKEGARAVALCVLIGDKIVLLNPVLERWIGLPAEELMGRSLIDLVHPDDREPLKDAIERIYDGLGALFIGVKMITRGKGVLWVVLTLNPVIYRERKAILVNIVDMTELRKVECSANDELFELQKAIFEAIPHAIVGLENRRIIFANNAVYDIFGWRPDELIGKTMRVLFHSDREYEEEGRKFYSILRKKRTHRIEFTYKRKDGKDVVCITSVSRIGDDPECRRVVATHTDITEMKRIERECNRLHEQLRKYTNHLHDMLEGERSVIAREIHDEIGQTLTALKMGLFRIREEVKGENGKLETELTSMINLVEGAIRSTRDLVAQLRPVLLDDLGFIPAMEWLIDEFQRMTDVEVDVVFHPVIEHIKLDK
ncbi:MAG: PAS domain S-box protein, partial [Synergistetes bacterium]|nr:PAS domain S-box protein [Synergistota bacterium]